MIHIMYVCCRYVCVLQICIQSKCMYAASMFIVKMCVCCKYVYSRNVCMLRVCILSKCVYVASMYTVEMWTMIHSLQYKYLQQISTIFILDTCNIHFDYVHTCNTHMYVEIWTMKHPRTIQTVNSFPKKTQYHDGTHTHKLTPTNPHPQRTPTLTHTHTW